MLPRGGTVGIGGPDNSLWLGLSSHGQMEPGGPASTPTPKLEGLPVLRRRWSLKALWAGGELLAFGSDGPADLVTLRRGDSVLPASPAPVVQGA